MQFFTLAMLSAAIGLAAQQPAQQPAEQATAAAYRSKSMTSSEARFVQTTLENSRRQVELAQMALDRTANPNVKQFAQRVINNQSSVNQQLEQIAKEYNIPMNFVPSANSPAYLSSQERTSMNWTGIDPKTHTGRSRFATVRLVNVKGEKFDQAFAKESHMDQESAVSRYEDERKTAMNPDLRNFIDSALPRLREQLAQAQTLK